MDINRLLHLAAASLVLLLATGCASVMRAPCDAPRISNRWAPQAYLVKLPLAADAPRVDADHRRDLETLLEMQAIASTSELGNSHLTLIDPPPNHDCAIADVYDAVTSNSRGLFWRRLFHSAVFLWGDVYEDSGDLFVKLYMKVHWSGADGTARVEYPVTGSAAPLVFTGRFPSSSIAFPRRRLNAAAMLRLAIGRGQMEARAIPDLDAPIVELPRRFVVASSDDRWLRLVSMEGRSFWLPKRELSVLADDLLPEFDFVRAVLAYAHFRSSGNPESARRALESLERFDRAFAGSSHPSLKLPRAVGDIMAGSLGQAYQVEKLRLERRSAIGAWLSKMSRAKTLSQELENINSDALEWPEWSYFRAHARDTADSDVLTLMTLSELSSCCSGPGAAEKVRTITEEFEAARDIDSANPAVLENLLNWYRVQASLDASLRHIAIGELTERIETLQRVLDGP